MECIQLSSGSFVWEELYTWGRGKWERGRETLTKIYDIFGPSHKNGRLAGDLPRPTLSGIISSPHPGHLIVSWPLYMNGKVLT